MGLIPKRSASSYIDSFMDWDDESRHGNNISSEVVYLYSFDLSNSFNWMGCVAFNSFMQVANEINDAPETWIFAAGVLDDCFDRVITRAIHQLEQHGAGINSGPSTNDPQGELLQPLASFCITSQIVAHHLNFEPGCHCIAIRYKPKNQPSILRSFVIPASLAKTEDRLSLDDLHVWLKILVDKDKLNNPDWFS